MYDRNPPIHQPVPYFSKREIDELKRKAKELKKDKPRLTHTQSLDLIAKSYDFSHWKVLQKHTDVDKAFKQLSQLPVIAIFDIKDYMSFAESAFDEGWWQSSEWFGQYLLPKLYRHYCANPPTYDLDDEGNLDISFEDFSEASSPVAVFPSVTPATDESVEVFMKQLSNAAFFAPMYIIKRGVIFDLFSEVIDGETRRLRTILGFAER